MKLKHIIIGLVSMLGIGAAVGAVNIHANQGETKVAEAATETTVYYAISSTDVGNYTVKLNVNRQGDASNWQQYTMEKRTSQSYNDKDVYSYTFTDLYDGLGNLQFQLYDGSTWVSQIEPINGWTSVSTYNNKLWEKGEDGWKDFTLTNYSIGYYLLGDHIGWTLSDGKLMSETSSGSGIYSYTKDYSAEEKVKVVKNNDIYGDNLIWYNAKDGDDYKVDSDHAYFYPVGADGDSNATVTNAGNYTLSFDTSDEMYHFYANDFSTPTAVVYFKNGTTGETGIYSMTNQELEITTTLTADTEFVISTTNPFGSFYYGYERVDSGSGSAIDAGFISQGDLKETGVNYIKVDKTKTFSIYIKDTGRIWMREADDITQAYSFARYFLTKVVCDPNGTSEPSGWSMASSRYSTLPSTCKETYFISGTADEHSSDEIKQALAKYDYAVTHHTGLTRFIVGRSLSANPRILAVSISKTASGAAPIIVSVIAVISLTAIGGYYFLSKNKKKENQ